MYLLGQEYKVSIEGATPGTFETITAQVTGGLNEDWDEVEVTNKDNAASGSEYLATKVNRTLDFSLQVVPGSSAKSLKTIRSYGGQSKNMKFETTVVGAEDFAFNGFIKSIKFKADVNQVATLDVSIRINGAITATTQA